MIIKIIRCKSKENPDTCEDFYKHTVNKYCEFLVSDNLFWKPYYNSIEPKFVCPLKKVRPFLLLLLYIYIIRNGCFRAFTKERTALSKHPLS